MNKLKQDIMAIIEAGAYMRTPTAAWNYDISEAADKILAKVSEYAKAAEQSTKR